MRGTLSGAARSRFVFVSIAVAAGATGTFPRPIFAAIDGQGRAWVYDFRDNGWKPLPPHPDNVALDQTAEGNVP